VSFLYWSLRRLLELLVLRRRSEREKEVEILFLRHRAAVSSRRLRTQPFCSHVVALLTPKTTKSPP
jgi:hypothetical protein